MILMQLINLHLRDFRNFEEAAVEFSPGINVFIGENAQGKTSLLEAIYMLSLARSHRTAKDREVIRWGSEFSRIEGRAERKTGQVPLSLTITKHGKIAKVNHLKQKRLSDYIGQINVVVFAPDDLDLVKGAPQERRRFLDMELSQMSNVYLHESSNYQKLLKQRNNYLRKIAHGEHLDTTYLAIITEQVARSASKLMVRRADFTEKLEGYAQPIHQEISDDQEILTLRYTPSLSIEEGEDEEGIYEDLITQFKAVEGRELEKGTTLLGPQRDDLRFYINDKDVQHYGSQGQQRTTVLSTKLAEIECMKESKGEYPILLLDDVLSELDESRQTHLLKAIEKKVQTFLTTTSLDGIQRDQIDDPEIYHIKAGTITKEASG